jgi:hypothetical protein
VSKCRFPSLYPGQWVAGWAGERAPLTLLHRVTFRLQARWGLVDSARQTTASYKELKNFMHSFPHKACWMLAASQKLCGQPVPGWPRPHTQCSLTSIYGLTTSPLCWVTRPQLVGHYSKCPKNKKYLCCSYTLMGLTLREVGPRLQVLEPGLGVGQATHQG